jgi:hypothetical protein
MRRQLKVGGNESAKFWLSALNNLRACSRSVFCVFSVHFPPYVVSALCVYSLNARLRAFTFGEKRAQKFAKNEIFNRL